MARIPPYREQGDAIGKRFAKLTDELEHAHQRSVEGQNGRVTAARRRAVLTRLSRRLERCNAMMAEPVELLRQ